MGRISRPCRGCVEHSRLTASSVRFEGDAIVITGQCLCGAVRYRIDAEPISSRACWCRLCQYIGAGSATVNVGFLSAALQVEGVLRDYESIADSGNRMHRRFCPACGTHLFSAAEARPRFVFVRAGTLDDREIARPVATIWTSAAPSWACIDATLPRVPEQPLPLG
ncbi:MAG: GFA family protein [Gammaproteobacteria bacterium]|nr:GFA family protein [Gammaproteobacteria bacterium]